MNEELPAAWDDYWTKMAADAEMMPLLQMGFPAWGFTSRLGLLMQRPLRRILLPGNGPSLLPYALVHLGYEVMAVDFSAVANDMVLSATPTPGKIASCLEHSPVKRGSAPGSLKVITADLMEWEPDAPLDAIYDDRCMMILPQEDWGRCAANYARWLGPDGFCFVHTVGLGVTIGKLNGDEVAAARAPFEGAFRDAGFREQEDLRYKASVPRHGKLVAFLHGIG